MTGPTYDDRAGAPGPGGEPYPGPEVPEVPPAGPATGPTTGPATGPTTGPATGPTTGPATAPATGPATGPTTTVPARTRVSGIWVASIAAVIVLLILLIFILQNSERVKINIFGANPTLPIGVALLLAAVLGALLVALIGAARVVQLRRTARKMARRAR